jgi:hypothetical protein
MATVLDVIKASFRLIGVLAQGETPSASEGADALSRLNLLLAQGSIERINIYTKRRDTHVLVAGTQTYTIGAGGAINVARPVKIDQAKVLQSNGLETDLTILLTAEQWNAIPEKNVSAVQPLSLYDDYAYPLSTLHLWPKPSGTPTLVLVSWQQLTGFTALTDTFDLPLGYQQAIEYNLAVLLAPEYGRPVDAVVASIAGSSRQAITQMNVAQGLPAIPQQPPLQQAA